MSRKVHHLMLSQVIMLFIANLQFHYKDLNYLLAIVHTPYQGLD